MQRFILTAAAVLAFGPAVFADDAAKVAKELEGTYSLKSAMLGGQPAPEQISKGLKAIVIKDGTIDVQIETDIAGKKEVRSDIASFKLDPSKKPAQIDLTPSKEKDKLRLGIYKFEKGELTLCIAREGDRPVDFDGKGEHVMKLVITKK